MEFLANLSCPFCGGEFSQSHFGVFERGNGRTNFGILSCYCGEFPVVSDIPILKRGGSQIGGPTVNELSQKIKAQEYEDVLLSLILTSSNQPKPPRTSSNLSSLVKKIKRKLTHSSGYSPKHLNQVIESVIFSKNTVAFDLFDLYFRKLYGGKVDPFDYFAYRFSQPRHLVALSFAPLISQSSGPILDLACGFGHITFNLTTLFSTREVFGLDNNFFLLYVAKHWIAPNANFVCCEADYGLPFRNNYFSAVLCSNSFHFFEHKLTCAQELRRLLSSNGVILLTSLRHSLHRVATPNLALPPVGYAELFDGMHHRLLPDRAVLERYLGKLAPCLSDSLQADVLDNEKIISLVASTREDYFADFGAFAEWPHAVNKLTLNPLYVAANENDKEFLHFHRKFPSTSYENDNVEMKDYLPEAIKLLRNPPQRLTQVAGSAEISALVDGCAFLDIPERYYNLDV